MCTGIPRTKQLLALQKAGGQQGIPPILDTSWLAKVTGDNLGSGDERCLPVVLSAGLWDGSHW